MQIRTVGVVVAAFMLAFAGQSQAAGTGSVDRADGWYPAGTNLVVKATPGANSYFDTWLGDTNGATLAGTQLTVTVSAPKNLQARFTQFTTNIAASAGANGTISPIGTVVVGQGNNQAFAITPNANYHVANVLVDSVSVGAVAGYTFTNVLVGHTIAASFAINTYTFTVMSAYGTPTPSGVSTSNWGTVLNASLTNAPILNGATTQYVCKGWSGTGSLTNGSGTNASFTLTNDTTMSWQWQTNYWVDFSIIGN